MRKGGEEMRVSDNNFFTYLCATEEQRVHVSSNDCESFQTETPRYLHSHGIDINWRASPAWGLEGDHHLDPNHSNHPHCPNHLHSRCEGFCGRGNTSWGKMEEVLVIFPREVYD
jgi:hypothetical protein